jgi:hypothetical protein
VYDGETFSNIYTLTPNVQILNTPPTASGLTLTATLTTSDDLEADWKFNDTDNDPETPNYIIKWYKDGSYQSAWDDSKIVPSSATAKGEVWNYTLQVYDGANYSIQYSSPSTTILNTPPTATDLMIPSNPTSSDTLTASWIASDIDGDNPDDYLNVTIIHWYKWNGTGWELQVGLEDSTTVGSGNLTRADIWHYSLQIYDGETYSIVYASPNTTILNSLPTVSNVSFNKTSGVSTDDTFNISYSYYDADNDPEDAGSLTIHWYIKGVYDSAYDGYRIIYSDNTTEGDIWQYKIRVFDGFNYSIEYPSILILIGDAANNPPSVFSLNITATPLTTDDIIAQYIYNDVDGINHSYGAPGTYEIFWYLNGTIQPTLNDSLSVSYTVTSKHQVWNYTLRVFDGLNWSIQYNSSVVSILNTPPQALGIDITTNPTTSTNLTATWIFTDADSDPEVSYDILWYVNGVYNSTYDNEQIIPFIATTKGEVWNYTLQVNDGENDSILYASPQTIIQNTPPSASGLMLTINPVTNDDLIATWSATDVDYSDSLTVNITWFLYGQKYNSWLTSATSATLTSGNTSKNQFWYYKIQVFDGDDSSTIYLSPNRQIQNTAPEIQEQVNITPSNPIRGTELGLNYTFYDIDDDIQYGTVIRWYRNGIIQPTYNDLLTVPGGTIFKNDRWYAVINVSDGTDTAIGVTSTEVIIGNTPPTADSASVFPDSNVYTSSTLVANFAGSDVDGDSTSNYSIIWKIGATPVPALENQTEVPSNFTSKGEYWTFEVRVFDGTDWSIPLEPGLGVIIQNSKPTISNVSLTGGRTTTEDILLSYDFIDIDNDSEDIVQTMISWYNPTPIIGPTGKTLAATYFTAGDIIFVTIIPHDGDDAGNPIITTVYSTGYINVGNTAPEILGTPNILGPNQSTSYSAATTLYANYSVFDIDSGSAEVYNVETDENGFVVGAEYRWFRDGKLVSGLTGLTVASIYLSKGEMWKFSVRPRDRYGDFGMWVNSTEIEIGNSWPQINSFFWINAYPTTQTTLSFSYEYFDLDDDLEWHNMTFIQWFKNGSEILSNQNQSVLPSIEFVKGDTIYVLIQVFDGKNYSIPYQSNSIIICNAIPEATSIFLLPLQVYTIDNLNLTWIYDDTDNDPENSNWLVYWYRNGLLVPEHTNKTYLESNYTIKGEVWKNTSLVINPSQNILINDPDQDPLVDYIIYWFENDTYQPMYDNQTLISSDLLFKGESWYAIVRVFDGDDWSQNKSSRVMFIINQPPYVEAFQFEFDSVNSHVEPDVRESSSYQFYVEGENIAISYQYMDADNDTDQLKIQWFKKPVNGSWIEVPSLENSTIVPSTELSPGEVWYCLLTPFDGTDQGPPKQSDPIAIESQPIIHSYSIKPDRLKEGAYTISVNATNERDDIYRVEFETVLVDNTTRNIVGIDEGENNWSFNFAIDDYHYLNTILKVTIKASSKVNNTEFIIFSTLSFQFTLDDKAPPRVQNAFFTKNDDVNPTNLTFNADIEEYGSGIAEIILYYYYQPVNNSNGGEGAEVAQMEQNWCEISMNFLNSSEGISRYAVTVPFVHNNSNVDILYYISTQDNEGNINTNAFDIRDYPQRINDQRFIFTSPGLPQWVLLAAALVIAVIFMGTVVYVRFIRKPELVGLDKELVLNKISEVHESEIMDALDAHTIGIMISFFDQRHGPIPIIVIPEILKDNFEKLVDLSDRSFSGTGFSDNFTAEIPSSYDFVLAQGLRTSIMSFGFALERPQARGGQENLTLNIIIHQDIFPLVQSFQKAIQRRVHDLHIIMDKNPGEKGKIRDFTFQLRKFVTAVVLSYETIYGTTELIEED